MNILIVGKSGVGKSNLGDIIRNTIFKLDNNAIIHTDDPDRSVKTFGTGSNEYNIHVRKIGEEGFTKGAIEEYSFEKDGEPDVVIEITSDKFKEWFREVYNK
jgi:CO dehydrogenase nickel-insertion accessory protein CooC1